MAEVQERKPEQPVIAKRSEIDAKAKEGKELRVLPISPGDKVGFKELLEWIKLITPDMIGDGGRLLMYVYRLDPVINRQILDPHADNNIDVIGGAIENFKNLSEQYFIERHGGGTYKIVVSDADNPEGRSKYGRSWFEAFLNIPIIQYPPKLDLREVDWDNRKNKGFKSWARSQKLIDENDNVMTAGQVPNNSAGGDQIVQAMKVVMDFTRQLSKDQEDKIRRSLGENDPSKGIHDIIIERMKQDDPNKQVSNMTSMITALKAIIPEQKGGSDIAAMVPMFIQMMQHQSDMANKQFQMMIELLRGNKENGGNGEGRESRMSELKDLLALAREIKGGSGGAKSQVAEIIDAAVPVVQPALQIIANITAMRAAAAGAPVGSAPNSPIGPSHSQVVNQAQPSVQPSAPPLGAQPMQLSQDEAVAIITQFRPIILNKLAGEGWELGAWITEGFGDMVASSVAKHGEATLLSAMKAIPDFWQAVSQAYNEDYVKSWLHSFVNYKEEMRKHEDDLVDD
jgi:hypothetical protein